MFTRLPLEEYLNQFTSKDIVRKLETLKTGTTTVGIVTKDGIVLATDKRATAGYFIANKNVKKIWKIDNHVAATMCGSVADVQRLLDELTRVAHSHKIDTGKPIPIKSLASYASLVLFSSRPFILVVHIIIGGYDPNEGPVLYALDWFGTVTRETKYTSTGSGSPIAFGVLEDGYREDMSINEALRLAVRAVYAAMMRDPGSGEGIVAVTITREGYREVPEEDIKKMLKSGQA